MQLFGNDKKYFVQIGDTDEQWQIFKLQIHVLFDYGQGKGCTALIKGRVLKTSNNEKINYSADADYICFEVPEEIPIDKLQEFGILECIEKKGALNNLEKDRYNYLGRLKQQDDDKTFILEEPEQSIIGYVHRKLDEEILKEKNRKGYGECNR